jgi:ankyrin repeat protein
MLARGILLAVERYIRNVAKDLQDMRDVIHTTYEEVKEGRRQQNEWQHRQECQAILDWLTTVDYTPQQNDFIGRRQAGTGQWLLDSDEYQAWLKTSMQTLFCPGIPGAGKTIITAIAIDDLNTRFQGDPTVGIAYIYCNFRRRNEQKADDLLASLLKQLSREWSSLPESLKILYEHHKGKRTRPSFDDVSKVLQLVAALYSRIFIIVDALDECQVSDGCRVRFLSEIFNFQAKSGANLFATSRFMPDIIEKFNGRTLLEIRASDDDVRRYLDGHMFRLPGFVVRSVELQEEITNEIAQFVDGMYAPSFLFVNQSVVLSASRFLLAQLRLDSLAGKISTRAIRTTLKKLPTGSNAYDCAYEDAMERIEGQLKDQEELAKRVLSWITCAKRPLATSELQHAFSVEVEPADSELDGDGLPQIEDVVSVCAGLVVIDKESDIIRLVHYTAEEYFQRTKEKWFPNAEADIAKVCLTYLSFDVFEGCFCLSDKDFETRLRLHTFYDYAAQNWGYHAHAASTEVEQLVLKFFKKEAQVSSASQAMIAPKDHWGDYGYSQRAPRQMRGVHLAAYFGLTDTMRTLLKNGQRPDLKDSHGRTPLSYAAENGHETMVKLLLEKDVDANSKATGNYLPGLTPLLFAAENGREGIVQLLLENGIDANSKAKDGWNAMHLAVKGGHRAVVELLWKKGGKQVSGQPCGDFQDKPIHSAAYFDHPETIETLINLGASIHERQNTEETALHIACQHGRPMVARKLLDLGADPTLCEIDDMTPLHFAARNGHVKIIPDLLEKQRRKRNLPAFLAMRCKPDGDTALHKAALCGLRFEPYYYPYSPVRAAVRDSTYLECFELLYKAGASISAVNNAGETPLHLASTAGNLLLVKFILNHLSGSERSKALGLATLTGGHTPLDRAIVRGHSDIVRKLTEAGADPNHQATIRPGDNVANTPRDGNCECTREGGHGPNNLFKIHPDP